MNLNGDFFSEKKKDFTAKQIECVKECVRKLDDIKDKPLMMLGKIQSGKTKTFIGVISLAFDNGYDLSVVLTKNSNALAKQTMARMESEFKNFIQDDTVNIFDIMYVPNDLSRYELNQKMILIVKKQHRNLPKLMNFIEQYSISENKRCLIIDDEADFCSIGYDKDKETSEFDLRKIASQINDLRLALTCRFIQVTATPYSLYLQPDEIEIDNEKEIRPIKPAHTVLVPSGEGYVGGDYYFNSEVNPIGEYLFQDINQNELDIIKSSDRRKFKEEDVLFSQKVEGLRRAIINFITGSCIRIIQNGRKIRGKNSKFSFIIHTEIQKISHKRQINLISELMDKLKKEVDLNSKYINELINNSYEELKESILAYGLEIPYKEEVINKFKTVVKEEWITKVVVNSESDVDTLLDSDGQLKLRTPLNIFVGGQILDRGVTISNLIGFYYGRRPNKMQQDTVLQHSRMFGYRSKEDLAVTRFYTTSDLYERMYKINEFDFKLREDFEQDRLNNGVIFISQDDNGRIIPCSPNKILVSKTHILKSGQRLLPIGFDSLCRSKVVPINNKIEDILMSNNNGTLKGEYKISKNEAIQILEYIFDTLSIENENSINKKDMVSMINYLCKDKMYVVCRTNRNISKRKKHRYYSDMPENKTIDLKVARDNAINEPVLILLKQNGLIELGWKGVEFWWPILIAPKNIKTSVYSSDISK